jgi:hypothetical protein
MRATVLLGVALLAVPLAVAVAAPLPKAEPVFLLPDLASLPPSHFTFEAPDGSDDGCTPREEGAGARRCLRFTTYVANVGAGRLDLGLAEGDGSRRQMVQRIHAGDGVWMERPAGLVEFHPVHDHYHVAGLVSFTLHAVDGEGVAASGATTAGGKTGFCLLDGAPGETLGGAEPGPRTYHRWNCKALQKQGVGMGITPGWVDKYNWTLADQYLEVSGVADGVYDLVVVADPGRTILETGRQNNAATVRLRIDGQSVLLLPTESP